MASFCWDCTPKYFGMDAHLNDIYGACEKGMMISALCEGCGPGWFDHTGKRVPERFTEGDWVEQYEDPRVHA